MLHIPPCHVIYPCCNNAARSWKWNIAGGSPNPGTDIIMWWDGQQQLGTTKMWVFNDVFSSVTGCVAAINPLWLTLALDIQGNNAYAGQRLELWDANYGPAQMFLMQCNVITRQFQPGKHRVGSDDQQQRLLLMIN